MEDPGDDNNDRLFGVFAVITAVEVADDVVIVVAEVDAKLVPVIKP